MFPPGYGAGMTLQLPNSHTFHLTVLYSSSKQERENQPSQDRLSRNRMLNQQRSSQGEEEVTYELQPALQQLCHTLNGFIFVVDASSTKQSGEGMVLRPLFLLCCMQFWYRVHLLAESFSSFLCLNLSVSPVVSVYLLCVNMSSLCLYLVCSIYIHPVSVCI